MMKGLVVYVFIAICTPLLGTLGSGAQNDRLSTELGKCNGYLLGFKLVMYDQPRQNIYYNHASLFKIEFDGRVTQLWNYSLGMHHTMFSDNLFAVDAENELVYLSVTDQFLALDLITGETKIEIPLKAPNLQFFWNYDYVPKDSAIYGVCTGNDAWNWCRIKLNKLHKQKIKLEFLYIIPNDILELSPTDDFYFMDKEHQSIWYTPGTNDVFGVNYTTGNVIFKGFDTLYNKQNITHDDCIVYDYSMNRIFTLVYSTFDPSYPVLAELHSAPGNETILMKLPTDIRPSHTGTCAYDPKTCTMIALMANTTTYLSSSMSYYLLLIDVVGLTYEMIPLPGLQKWTETNNGYWPLTAVKFIPMKP